MDWKCLMVGHNGAKVFGVGTWVGHGWRGSEVCQAARKARDQGTDEGTRTRFQNQSRLSLPGRSTLQSVREMEDADERWGGRKESSGTVSLRCTSLTANLANESGVYNVVFRIAYYSAYRLLLQLQLHQHLLLRHQPPRPTPVA